MTLERVYHGASLVTVSPEVADTEWTLCISAEASLLGYDWEEALALFFEM